VGSTSWDMAEKNTVLFQNFLILKKLHYDFQLGAEGDVLIIVRNCLWRRVLKQRQNCPFRLREVIWGGAEV
jgi:hypothetical protein